MALKNTAIIASCRNNIFKPQDNVVDKIVYFTKTNDKGVSVLVPLFSSEHLSFETIKMVRKDLGLTQPKSIEDLEKELSAAVQAVE